MNEQQRLVAVISPWEKLSHVVKHEFRMESLPGERMVAVWRDDLQTEDKLAKELNSIGVHSVEIRQQKVKTSWRHVD
jgi:hypothetical protein